MFERDARRREIAIKEREQTTREGELQLKRLQYHRDRWFSPLVLAIFAAAVAALGNAIVAYMNGTAQRELETDRNRAQSTLEATKSEASFILEMIRTNNDPDKAAINLQGHVRQAGVDSGL